MRGGEHLADCEKKAKEKPLWKHILEKHEGKMEGGKFEHFDMIQTTGGQREQGRGVVLHVQEEVYQLTLTFRRRVARYLE